MAEYSETWAIDVGALPIAEVGALPIAEAAKDPELIDKTVGDTLQYGLAVRGCASTLPPGHRPSKIQWSPQLEQVVYYNCPDSVQGHASCILGADVRERANDPIEADLSDVGEVSVATMTRPKEDICGGTEQRDNQKAGFPRRGEWVCYKDSCTGQASLVKVVSFPYEDKVKCVVQFPREEHQWWEVDCASLRQLRFKATAKGARALARWRCASVWRNAPSGSNSTLEQRDVVSKDQAGASES